MKINKIFIASIILLAVITLGAVSAADDISTQTDVSDDSLSLENEITLEAADEEPAGNGEKMDLDLKVSPEKEMTNYSAGCINHGGEMYIEDIDEDFQIPFDLLVDGEKREILNFDMTTISFNTSGLSLGEHSFLVNFFGNKLYNPANTTGTFEICDIAVNAPEEYMITGDGDSVRVTLPLTASGYVSVEIGNDVQTKDIPAPEDYEDYFSLYFFIGGYHIACGENNITVKLNDKTIRTLKMRTDYEFRVDDDNLRYGKDVYFFGLPVDMNEELVTITIDGKVYEAEYKIYGDGMFNGARTLSINITKELSIGNHTVIVSYSGDEYFTKKSFEATIVIKPKVFVEYNVMRSDNITLFMPDDAEGDIEIWLTYVDGEELKPFKYASVKAAGDVFIPLSNLDKIGTYSFDYRYTGSDYKVYSDCTFFILNPDLTYPKTHIIGNEDYISIDWPDHNGTLSFFDQHNNEISVNLTDGKASIPLKTVVLPEGKQSLEVILREVYDVDPIDGYEYANYYNYYLDIEIVKPEITLPADRILLGEGATVSVDLPGFNGSLIVREYVKEGEGEEKELVDGKATVNVVKLDQKRKYYAQLMLYTLDIDQNLTYEQYVYEFTVDVISPIAAKDAKPLYSANEKYSVKITDIDGKAIKSGKVTFYILDGKKQILKKTVDVKNGAATLSYKITQGVKTYTIKTVFNKAAVTKKLAVKHVVTLKTATVKKSAKKLTLQATLAKVNGKYLKNKKVTFKFNGKTYKAKTDKKGVVKVAVKSSVLKKLKVGKKITYQATYLKDTVKKTAIVKK